MADLTTLKTETRPKKICQATNRAAIINKLFKVAKKHYPPILPSSNRTVLEHMMFACCLENTQYEAADESFARLQEQFFDWNEVRVTTAVELAEVMKQQPDPSESAVLIKKTLHGVFENLLQLRPGIIKKRKSAENGSADGKVQRRQFVCRLIRCPSRSRWTLHPSRQGHPELDGCSGSRDRSRNCQRKKSLDLNGPSPRARESNLRLLSINWPPLFTNPNSIKTFAISCFPLLRMQLNDSRNGVAARRKP